MQNSTALKIAHFTTPIVLGAITCGSIAGALIATATAPIVAFSALALISALFGACSISAACSESEDTEVSKYYSTICTHAAKSIPFAVQFIVQLVIISAIQGICNGIRNAVSNKFS